MLLPEIINTSTKIRMLHLEYILLSIYIQFYYQQMFQLFYLRRRSHLLWTLTKAEVSTVRLIS